MASRSLLALDVPLGNLKPISPRLINSLLRALDGCVVVVTGFLTFLALRDWQALAPDTHYYVAIFAGAVAASFVFNGMDFYREDPLASKAAKFDHIALALFVTICLLLAAAFVFGVTSTFSRLWAVCWFASAVTTLVSVRLIAGAYVRRLASAGRMTQRTVILGAGVQGQKLADHLAQTDDPRIRVVGFVDDRSDRVPKEVRGIPVLGDTRTLLHLIEEKRVDQILIALPWHAEGRLMELVLPLMAKPVGLRLAPDMTGYRLPHKAFTRLGGLPLLQLYEDELSGWRLAAKTFEDKCLACCALVALLPLLVVIAAAVKLTSPGPLLRQNTRFDFGGRPIKLWRYRVADPSCVRRGGNPRVPPVGRLLRRSGLEYLPRLFNILRGELSIVGPALRPTTSLDNSPRLCPLTAQLTTFAGRYKVKPGLTGLADVRGCCGAPHNPEEVRKRIELDFFYIEHWSIGLDIWIMGKTLTQLWRGDRR